MDSLGPSAEYLLIRQWIIFEYAVNRQSAKAAAFVVSQLERRLFVERRRCGGYNQHGYRRVLAADDFVFGKKYSTYPNSSA